MKLGVSAASLAFLTLAMGQEIAPELKHMMSVPLNGSRPVSLSALSIERGVEYPTIVKLTGNVEIRTPVCLPSGQDWKPICDGDMIVRAGEAQFHEDTGQIEAQGNVVVTPIQHEARR